MSFANSHETFTPPERNTFETHESFSDALNPDDLIDVKATKKHIGHIRKTKNHSQEFDTHRKSFGGKKSKQLGGKKSKHLGGKQKKKLHSTESKNAQRNQSKFLFQRANQSLNASLFSLIFCPGLLVCAFFFDLSVCKMRLEKV